MDLCRSFNLEVDRNIAMFEFMLIYYLPVTVEAFGVAVYPLSDRIALGLFHGEPLLNNAYVELS